MALTDQPYIPLYVGDWLSNNKLKLCSATAHGLMINIMCLMHKEETYGKILLKQKFKQKESKCLQFASMFAKLLPFDLLDIEAGLSELLEEKVLAIDGDFLVCERMVNDAELSLKRSFSGKLGGQNSLGKTKKFAQAKPKANTEIESINENEIENEFISLEKSEKPFLQITCVDWQADEDFVQAYAGWRVMLFIEYRTSFSESQHLAAVKFLKDFTKSEAIACLYKATLGKYKSLYPEKGKQNGKGQSFTKNAAEWAAQNDPNWKSR